MSLKNDKSLIDKFYNNKFEILSQTHISEKNEENNFFSQPSKVKNDYQKNLFSKIQNNESLDDFLDDLLDNNLDNLSNKSKNSDVCFNVSNQNDYLQKKNKDDCQDWEHSSFLKKCYEENIKQAITENNLNEQIEHERNLNSHSLVSTLKNNYIDKIFSKKNTITTTCNNLVKTPQQSNFNDSLFNNSDNCIIVKKSNENLKVENIKNELLKSKKLFTFNNLNEFIIDKEITNLLIDNNLRDKEFINNIRNDTNILMNKKRDCDANKIDNKLIDQTKASVDICNVNLNENTFNDINNLKRISTDLTLCDLEFKKLIRHFKVNSSSNINIRHANNDDYVDNGKNKNTEKINKNKSFIIGKEINLREKNYKEFSIEKKKQDKILFTMTNITNEENLSENMLFEKNKKEKEGDEEVPDEKKFKKEQDRKFFNEKNYKKKEKNNGQLLNEKKVEVEEEEDDVDYNDDGLVPDEEQSSKEYFDLNKNYYNNNYKNLTITDFYNENNFKSNQLIDNKKNKNNNNNLTFNFKNVSLSGNARGNYNEYKNKKNNYTYNNNNNNNNNNHHHHNNKRKITMENNEEEEKSFELMDKVEQLLHLNSETVSKFREFLKKEEDLACSSAVPLARSCLKPFRVGLSRKYKGPHLHNNLAYK